MTSTTSPIVSRIRDKCRIADGSLDTHIAALVDELQPAIQFAIRPEILASTDSSLVATVNLAITEIVSAELLEERVRDASILTSSTPDSSMVGLRVSDRLRHRGWVRLKPYLKSDLTIRTPSVAA